MKSLIAILLVLSVVSCDPPSQSEPEATKPAPAVAQPDPIAPVRPEAAPVEKPAAPVKEPVVRKPVVPVEATIYVVQGRDIYHQADCRHLRKATHTINNGTISEAKRLGYRACKVCNPR